MQVQGRFEVKMQAEPPYDETGGVPLAQATVDKTFQGPLEAISSVRMLSARTPVSGSAGYVALEKISGKLEGKEGSFTVVHLGLMHRGQSTLTVQIVPDSGTGALVGIAGTMNIDIKDGQHFYAMDYRFEDAPA